MKLVEGWFKIKGNSKCGKAHYFKFGFPVCNTPFNNKLDKVAKSYRQHCKSCLNTLQTYNDLHNKIVDTFKEPI